MAEVTSQNLYNQLTPMGQLYYDQQFKKQYTPGKENILLSSQPEYEKMKAVFESEQQVPEKSLLSSLNPFSSASAAEAEFRVPDKINNISNTPGFQTVVNTDGTISIVPIGTSNDFPFKSMAELAAANAIPITNQTPFDPRNLQSVFPTTVSPGINNTTSAAMFLDNAGLPAIDTSFGVANEEDVEEDVEGAKKRTSKGGIADLFRAILGFIVPGAGAILGAGNQVLSGVKSLNQRLRDNDFARSSTGAEYFQRRRDRKAREDAAKRGLLKQKQLIASQQIDTGGYIQDTNDPGSGIGTYSGGAPSPGSQGPGGSDEMGSF